MKKVTIAIAVIAIVATLTSCSHNIGTAFQGRLLNVGYDPETNKAGIQYYNGLFVTGVGRENSEVALEYTDSGKGTASSTAEGETTATFKYQQKVGKQITGYYVDALEAGAKPEELDKYTSSEEAKETKTEETK